MDEGRRTWRSTLYRPTDISWVTWAEGLAALSGIAILAMDLHYGAWAWMPFHLLATVGFAAMFGYSLIRA